VFVQRREKRKSRCGEQKTPGQDGQRQTAIAIHTVGTTDWLSRNLSVELNAGSSSKAFVPVIPAGIPKADLRRFTCIPYISAGEPPRWVD
jgi:hypothetical protein